MKRVETLAAVGIGVALLVLVLKLLAWKLTGSIALLSDAMESIINVAAAGAAWLAVKVSAKPADDNHPYGHHKAEYFAAVTEGVLIVLAALAIGNTAWAALQAPRELDFSVAGMGLNILASMVNAAWCYVLLREGRALRSPALVADGRHVLSDVVSSAGVLLGVVLAIATGWSVLDPLLGLAVAANIVWSGVRLIRESIGGLMDEALPADVVARIQAVLADSMDGALETHDLRTRQAGQRMFVEFHLVVPGVWSVRDAHDLCDRMEEALRTTLGGEVMVTIHVEPEHKAKHI